MDIACPLPGSPEAESSHRQPAHPNPGAVWRVILMPSEVPSDLVEFVLVSAPWIWHEKRLNIHEAPSLGGVWNISTLNHRRSARDGLYTSQLGNENDSAYLEVASHFCTADVGCSIHNPIIRPEFVTSVSDKMKVWCIPGGTRAYIYFFADSLCAFPVQSIETFRTAENILSFAGGNTYEQVIIEVQPNAVPLDVVEIVLTNDGIEITSHDIQILESPAVGSGVWTISIGGPQTTSGNGLYKHQLNGALLKLSQIMNTHDAWDEGPVIDLTHAVPGTRYIFHWWPN